MFLLSVFVRESRCTNFRFPVHSYDQWPYSRHFWQREPLGKAAASFSALKEYTRNVIIQRSLLIQRERISLFSSYRLFWPNFWAAIPPNVIAFEFNLIKIWDHKGNASRGKSEKFCNGTTRNIKTNEQWQFHTVSIRAKDALRWIFFLSIWLSTWSIDQVALSHCRLTHVRCYAHSFDSLQISIFLQQKSFLVRYIRDSCEKSLSTKGKLKNFLLAIFLWSEKQ